MKPEEKQASQAIQNITGIGNTSVHAIISVIGTNMGRLPTDRHISSWADLCPGDNESAKKRRSGKTRKGNALLRTTLINCTHAAVREKNHISMHIRGSAPTEEVNARMLPWPTPC